MALAAALLGLPAPALPASSAAAAAADAAVDLGERSAEAAADTELLDWPGAVRRLLADNPDVALARIGVEAAEADRLRAAARANPVLTVSDAGWRRGGPLSRESDWVVRLDQLIERGGKRALRIAGADAALAAAGLDLADARRQLLTGLAASFADLTAAQRRAGLAREVAEAFRRAADLADRRVRAGDLAAADAVRARADAARALNDVSSARLELQAARSRLAQLLGRPEDAPRLAVDASGMPEAGALDPQAVVAARPDVRAAAQRVEAARLALDLARAQRTRDVSVGVQLERLPTTGDSAVGVALAVPLFVNYRFEGEIGRATADLDAARVALERQRQAALAELQRQRDAFDAARERERRFADEIVPLVRRAADASRFAFARGAASVLEVLDAQRQLRAAESEAIAASAERIRAQGALAALVPQPEAPAP